ncbi:uncharacterized protein At1g04910-like isoform X2 [Asparagus officinalis]|uniref:uncharacterized protein At1g04910-like isoform X2 n=1 Tax=Asparagus officinalis TaxID=4686 RepID=UPI00098DE28B|nr:uncharacterized protein At1g04910-like isoform X2 [Asparagus officinalis]
MLSSSSWNHRMRPIFFLLLFALSLAAAAVVFFPSSEFSTRFLSTTSSFKPFSTEKSVIWTAPRVFEWRPCSWWTLEALTALPERANGYIRVDCYGGLNQLRRDLCDGIGIARILNATLVLPKFEVAAYWNESSGFGDVFDVDYFIQETKGFIEIVRELPKEIASREPFKVDCSKRKGLFDYVEAVLPSLLEHRYISIAPAMSQRRDRYPLYAKAAFCQACYNALRLNKALESKALDLLNSIPKPFLSLHLRFEPDMVAYSQCQYSGLSSQSQEAIESARGDRKPWTGDSARIWRARGKCPLTPKETAFILKSLNIPTNTTIYLAAGDGIMEVEGFTSVYTNVYTKASFLSSEDIVQMHVMRTLKGKHKTLFLSRRGFSVRSAEGMRGDELREAMWREHREDFVTGRGLALPDCFCEFRL